MTKLREGGREVALFFVARHPDKPQVMPSLKKHDIAHEAPPE
jgi:hypothetical protein